MGLLNKLFGTKEKETPPEVIREARETMERYLSEIQTHYGESHFDSDSQASQILAVYSFGGISALAMQNGMNPVEAHALCLALFYDFFGFDPDDSAAKAEAVISAAPDNTSHLYPLIHRGLDGFLHWQSEGGDGAAKDFAEIMQHFQKDDETE